MKPLILNLKSEYFDAIRDGKKPEEFREVKEYWANRLIDGDGDPIPFSEIIIRKGYPKSGDPDREIRRPWRGWRIKEIKHAHFSAEPVTVFAIRV
jgi:hypothetical protein